MLSLASMLFAPSRINILLLFVQFPMDLGGLMRLAPDSRKHRANAVKWRAIPSDADAAHAPGNHFLKSFSMLLINSDDVLAGGN
jgi:hypothetical protein